MRKKYKERWCVKHRDGWCATKTGKPHKQDAVHVPTRCEHVITLPRGSEKRIPTCDECRNA